MKRFKVLGAGLAVCTAAITIGALLPASELESPAEVAAFAPPTSDAAASARPEHVPAAASVSSVQRRVGEVRELAMRLGSEMLQGDAPRARLAAEGLRTETCYRSDASGAVIGVRFTASRLRLEGLQPALTQAIRSALATSREVLLQLDPRGAITGLALLDPPANAYVRDQLRSWAVEAHLVGAPSPDAVTWSAPGWDTLGEAVDTYTRSGDVVDRARSLEARGPFRAQLEGSVRAQWRAGGLAALVGKETIRVALGSLKATTTREVWLDLQRVRALPEARLNAMQARLAHVTWERELVTEATASERPPRALAEQLPALQKGQGSLRELARTLRSAPGAIAQALTAFATLPQAGRRRLLAALGRADTLASQRALLGLARGELADALIPTAFAALGQAQYPSPETVAFLRDQSRLKPGSERQRWGTLGLGLVARNAAEAGSADQAALHLQDNLEAATETPQRLLTLSALGNGGREVSFEAVALHAQDGEAAVRARALFALRHVDVEEAQLLLTSGALLDEAVSVRREAVHGLALRGPTPYAIETLTKVARRDADPSVRLEAIDGVATWLTVKQADLEPETASALRALLQEAQGDTDDGVRAAASAGLRG